MRKSFIPICLVISLAAGVSAEAAKLPRARPEKVGMSSLRLRRLDAVVGEAVRRGDPPGAVLLVSRRGRVVYRKEFGLARRIPRPEPMRIDSMFDLASMTKPLATASSIMLLVERGRLRLDDAVTEFVPGFRSFREGGEDSLPEARIRHLLTHTSGLPPYLSEQELAEFEDASSGTADLVVKIAGLDKLSPPGEEFHYSCLGYITLAFIVQEITGRTLADFAAENIFRPLRMKNTMFNPAEHMRTRCVPTEIVEGTALQGEVHDPLARLQGGISGNAGLFSTADDLAVFADMLLHGGRFGKTRIFSPLTVDRMTEICPELDFSGRGLGWDLDSPYSSCGGDLFGPDAFGHTGYTGTSIWIDSETETVVLLLTNRVHPDDSGSVTALRGRVANIAAAAIMEKPPEPGP